MEHLLSRVVSEEITVCGHRARPVRSPPAGELIASMVTAPTKDLCPL
jgi:hypothetical protein